MYLDVTIKADQYIYQLNCLVCKAISLKYVKPLPPLSAAIK